MPRWVLHCPSCQQEFTHTQIEKGNLADHVFERKPDFPANGLSIECPHCHNQSVFHRSELTYRSD